MILSFELTMSNVGSWDGRWTGKDKKYYKHKKLSKLEGKKILNGKECQSWYYNFEDGWGASVSVIEVSASEKNKRDRISAGFSTYEWMINEILEHGRILERQERQDLRSKKSSIT